MTARKEPEIKSQEVQELLGIPPSWLMQWGTTFIIFGISLLVAIGWWVTYPDVVVAQITIAKDLPPESVQAKADGLIGQILVNENTEVKKNEPVAVYSNPANFEDIKSVEGMLQNFQPYNPSTYEAVNQEVILNLGELQGAYTSFLKSVTDYQMKALSDHASIESNQIEKRISKLQKTILKNEIDFDAAKIKFENLNATRQAKINEYSEGKVNLETHRKRMGEITDAKLEMNRLQSTLEANKAELQQAEKEITRIGSSRKQDKSASLDQINTLFNALKKELENWKEKYLILAPITGTANFYSDEIRKGKIVKTGEEIMAILPPSNRKMVGTVNLPVELSGKVQENQRVLISLTSFPYQSWGKLEGKVKFVSKIPRDNFISVEVSLNNGLETTKNKTVTMNTQLVGTAEILTTEKKFIVRIFENLFA